MATEPSSHPEWPDWPEDDYTAFLTAERHLYAWCLAKYGGITLPLALEEANRRYPYQPPNTPYRGMIFHDISLHWAMLKIYGELYWKSHPELEKPSAEYEVESARMFRRPK